MANSHRYSESVDVLYAKNILSVRQNRTILAFPQVMLPHRLAAIREMKIDLSGHLTDLIVRRHQWPEAVKQEWKCVCEVLFKMGICGLQRLEIILNLYDCGHNQYDGNWRTDDELASLLEPLMGIRIREFRVIMHHWPQHEEDVLRILGGRDPPFSIEL